MPIDPSLIPALEEELWAAKRPSPGGQPPNPGRIAAIEESLAVHRAAAKAQAKAAEVEQLENLSNESTDYQSNDEDKVTKARAAADKRKAEKAVATSVPETTDAE